MGSLLCRLFASFISIKANRIPLLGLDASGRTTILYRLKMGEMITTIPTVGFNVETVEPLKGVRFNLWDIGGGCKIRALWHHYCEGSDGIIFVIDCSDRDRISEARELLFATLSNYEMLPLVVFANKQDLPNVMSVSEVEEKLRLSHLKNPWCIQETCGISGDGLLAGLKTMNDMIKQSSGKHA